MTAVERMAAGLSEAQKAILSQPMGISTHRFYAGARHRACRALVTIGALAESQDGIGNPMFRFTPLGLALRDHLRAQEGKAFVCVSCDGPTSGGLCSHCRAILRNSPPTTDFSSSTERARLIARISELEEGLRPFAEAAVKFTSGVHYGGIENVRAAPHPEEFRKARALLSKRGM